MHESFWTVCRAICAGLSYHVAKSGLCSHNLAFFVRKTEIFRELRYKDVMELFGSKWFFFC